MNQQQQNPKQKGKKRFISIIAALVIAAVAYFFNIDLSDDVKENQAPIDQQAESIGVPVELIRTIDGDTIKVKYEGEERNIRYLLIDTPEIDHKNPENTEPFAMEAKVRNEELLKSGNVTIEFDEGDHEDKYGRLLAYIYVDGKSVQETLLTEGLARVAYVFEPNTKYIDEFNEAADKAKDAKKGVWEKEGYVTNRGFNVDVYGGK